MATAENSPLAAAQLVCDNGFATEALLRCYFLSNKPVRLK